MRKKGRPYIKRFDDDEEINPSLFSYNDWELGQEIEEAIEDDESISIENKQDLQVIVERGIVILKGRVYSHQDRITLGVKASAFVGYNNVINEIEVLGEGE